MKRLMILTVGLCLLITVAPVMAQSAADEAAIKKANADRIAVWNAKDANAYPAFFDKDCTASFDGGPCGADAFPEEWKNAKIRVVKDIGIAFITPGVAILRYTTENTGFLDANGKPGPPGKSQNARVYVKKDGKWLMATSFQLIEE